MDTPDQPDLALGAIIAAGLLIITEVLAPVRTARFASLLVVEEK
jgi:hypothetical protein